MSPDSTSLVIAVYRGDCALCGDSVNTGHVDRSAVLDGDVDPVLLLEGVDGLAAGTDEQADLIRRDLEHLDPWGEVRDLSPGLGDGLAG